MRAKAPPPLPCQVSILHVTAESLMPTVAAGWQACGGLVIELTTTHGDYRRSVEETSRETGVPAGARGITEAQFEQFNRVLALKLLALEVADWRQRPAQL